jgi:hypothetical protein
MLSEPSPTKLGQQRLPFQFVVATQRHEAEKAPGFVNRIEK